MASKKVKIKFKSTILSEILKIKGKSRRELLDSLSSIQDRNGLYNVPISQKSFNDCMQSGEINPYLLDLIAKELNVDIEYLKGNITEWNTGTQKKVKMSAWAKTVARDDGTNYEETNYPPYGYSRDINQIDKEEIINDLLLLAGVDRDKIYGNMQRKIPPLSADEKNMLLSEISIMITQYMDNGYKHTGTTPHLQYDDAPLSENQTDYIWEEHNFQKDFYSAYVKNITFRNAYLKNPSLNEHPYNKITDLTPSDILTIKHNKNYPKHLRRLLPGDTPEEYLKCENADIIDSQKH